MSVQLLEEPDGGGWGEAATVRAAQAGNDLALAHLLAEHLPLVRGVAGRALSADGDLAALDDVVQDVMLRVVASLSTLRDPAALRSWLIAITVRQVRDRRRGRRHAARHLVSLDDVADVAEVADIGADPGDAGEARWTLARQRREMVDAVALLTDADREVLLWWGRERQGDVDRAEVARRLGVNAGHTAVRVLRARRRLDDARVVARCAQRGVCHDLADILAKPTPSLVARARRHVFACPVCTHGDDDGYVPAELLLAARAVEAALLGSPRLPARRPSARSAGRRPGTSGDSVRSGRR